MNWLVVRDAAADHHDNTPSEFTLAEVLTMEKLFKEKQEKSLDQHFCQEVATSFSQSASRTGKSLVLWEQVQDWFREKLYMTSIKFVPLSVGIQEPAAPSYPTSDDITLTPRRRGTRGVKYTQDTGDKMVDISELAYEAKSARDNAWYDVGSFLTYRVLSSGELEVRVRFSGFDKDDDEWVNVKRHVRQRSIPLEAAECHQVKVGDLVLCYQDRVDYSVYCDAHIIGIERRIHDIRGCRCIFFVRYVDDGSEEQVSLTGLCARPT